MAKISKRRKAILENVVPGKIYPMAEALAILKKCATAKFDESFEVAVNLGIDANKSDQNVRGATVLPNGTGKSVRVAVFAQDEQAAAAKAAGAEIAGFEDLAETIKKGEINFDVLIATPDAMRLIGQLGQILGPKGLMPNPKVGTVTKDVVGAVKNAKAGQVRFRTDKNGIVHCAVGKISFAPEAITQNIQALLGDLRRLKPSTAKGQYFKKLTLSTTMGPGIAVDVSAIA
jgi:large subunit ribosomal protein L1